MVVASAAAVAAAITTGALSIGFSSSATMSMCALPAMFLVPEMKSDARKCDEDVQEFGASDAAGLDDARVTGQADLSNIPLYTPPEADEVLSMPSEIGRGLQ